MAETCMIVCLLTGSIVLVLAGLALLNWVEDKYMDFRDNMVKIKYGEKKISYINEHWDEIRKYVEEKEHGDW